MSHYPKLVRGQETSDISQTAHTEKEGDKNTGGGGLQVAGRYWKAPPCSCHGNGRSLVTQTGTTVMEVIEDSF